MLRLLIVLAWLGSFSGSALAQDPRAIEERVLGCSVEHDVGGARVTVRSHAEAGVAALSIVRWRGPGERDAFQACLADPIEAVDGGDRSRTFVLRTRARGLEALANVRLELARSSLDACIAERGVVAATTSVSVQSDGSVGAAVSPARPVSPLGECVRSALGGLPSAGAEISVTVCVPRGPIPRHAGRAGDLCRWGERRNGEDPHIVLPEPRPCGPGLSCCGGGGGRVGR